MSSVERHFNDVHPRREFFFFIIMYGVGRFIQCISPLRNDVTRTVSPKALCCLGIRCAKIRQLKTCYTSKDYGRIGTCTAEHAENVRSLKTERQTKTKK